MRTAPRHTAWIISTTNIKTIDCEVRTAFVFAIDAVISRVAPHRANDAAHDSMLNLLTVVALLNGLPLKRSC